MLVMSKCVEGKNFEMYQNGNDVCVYCDGKLLHSSSCWHNLYKDDTIKGMYFELHIAEYLDDLVYGAKAESLASLFFGSEG